MPHGACTVMRLTPPGISAGAAETCLLSSSAIGKVRKTCGVVAVLAAACTHTHAAYALHALHAHHTAQTRLHTTSKRDTNDFGVVLSAVEVRCKAFAVQRLEGWAARTLCPRSAKSQTRSR